jgi:hypothetical protein
MTTLYESTEPLVFSDVDLIASGDYMPPIQMVQLLIQEIESDMNHPAHTYKGWIRHRNDIYKYAGIQLAAPIPASSAFHHIINVTTKSILKKARNGEMTSQEKDAVMYELDSIIQELRSIDVVAAIEAKKQRRFKHQVAVIDKL